MPNVFEPHLDQLVAANREHLIPIAQQVAKTETWSLSLRCAVIDCTSGLAAVHNSSVGGVGSFIRTSTVIDHPLMEHFLGLVHAQGVDAALEAMAARVPVISTNTGGLPEVNRHGVTGMMSEVGDVDEMASNAIFLLEDEGRLQQFRDRARGRAEEFQVASIMPQYEAIYNQVLQPRTA